jgi:hypothetical protein
MDFLRRQYKETRGFRGLSNDGIIARNSMEDTEIIFSVQESPEGGYEARALGHDIFTQGDTMDELRAMVRDAVRCHFNGDSAPVVIRLHIVKDEVIPA